MNMINSFLGRMHLASHLELLTEEQLKLVKEGVEYYKTLSEAKKKALPYFPNGFSRWGDEFVVAGFETDEKIYLAVWNLKNEESVLDIPVKEYIKKAFISFPKQYENVLSLKENELLVKIKAQSAIMLELQK